MKNSDYDPRYISTPRGISNAGRLREVLRSNYWHWYSLCEENWNNRTTNTRQYQIRMEELNAANQLLTDNGVDPDTDD